ncbi:MAG: DUF4177 domain-containing protein [Sulfitobacter sp.]|nr:DUF4177 domain-containing protein [Sulfitobacter sp.]
MPRFEYKVVPAPKKGLKGKDIKGVEARFSHALEELMNSLASEGWEYQRAETLPSTERSGLTGTTKEWRNVLIFRRPHASDTDAFSPELLPAPKDMAPGQDGSDAKADSIAPAPQGDMAVKSDDAHKDTTPSSNTTASKATASKTTPPKGD